MKKKEIKDKLSTLFDETNNVNENIVAMTFFMFLFFIFSFAFMFAGALSAFSIYPVISFLMIKKKKSPCFSWGMNFFKMT